MLQSSFTSYIEAHLRELSSKSRPETDRTSCKIALLGNSTLLHLRKNILSMLRPHGIDADIFVSDNYDRYHEELMFLDGPLKSFCPDYIFIHATSCGGMAVPCGNSHETRDADFLREYTEQLNNLIDNVKNKFNCPLFLTNYEYPLVESFGSLGKTHQQANVSMIDLINQTISSIVSKTEETYLLDITHLSSVFGLQFWQDDRLWHSFKIPYSQQATTLVAHKFTRMLLTHRGKAKKCLVVDLDNTLWGGVIGDDGVNGIKIGLEDPVGAAYWKFQKYLLELKKRGVMLAFCSKNEADIALSGFEHSGSVLKPDDFVAYRANWEPKHQNIVELADELNIGLDSIAFFDDNPAEREIVKRNLPEVTVFDVPKDVAKYCEIIDALSLFEPLTMTSEDLRKNNLYIENKKRTELKKQFDNFSEFLNSLKMKAEISEATNADIDRTAQLLNKTNQFNLTGKKYSASLLRSIRENQNYMILTGRLWDRFGDNGLTSVIIARRESDQIFIDNWVMSCRVFQRNFEHAMLDSLITSDFARGAHSIEGEYNPTNKNRLMVENLENLQFVYDSSKQRFSQTIKNYEKQNRVIEIE